MHTPITLDAPTLALINRYQHNMPLTPCPYASMGAAMGWPRNRVLQILQTLHEQKVLSRFGPVFEHRRAGASTLVAMAIPPDQLETVAAHINGYDAVNHNYQRDHEWNLWFVLTAANPSDITNMLRDMAQQTGFEPMSLPMVRPFHIDLGFPLAINEAGRVVVADDAGSTRQADGGDTVDAVVPGAAVLDDHTRQALRHWLENGLPLVANPWEAFARSTGVSAAQVLSQVRQWQADGLFRRCGLVIRHHPLGIRANLMLVLDIPDADTDRLGRQLGAAPGVTLCYERPRRLPHWPYNLFCMIHGHDRSAVEQRARRLLADHGLADIPHQFLFSLRAFKQRGGRYLSYAPDAASTRPATIPAEAP
ncbi:MAG TPA: Lrp/AsnC family transcriptional regulator [Burkholderiaceae bacterium]|nr:Lrp/AsnC family transcriptional regulator [Burkholderiaceae bacterium]